MSALRIAMGADAILAGQLNDTPSAQALGTALPVGDVAALWGRAICFAAPLAVHPDDPQAPTIAVGAIAYWLPGQSICLCWGAAPASVDERPRAASPVPLPGRFPPDIAALDKASPGSPVRWETAWTA